MDASIPSPYLVPFDGSWRIDQASTRPEGKLQKKSKLRAARKACTEQLYELQHRLYAGDRHSLLVIFQALDAAGKDGTIKAVMSGVNPAGCQVASFKRPSTEELDHDFMWRCWKELPRRGNIGIFNRSYYEEVLAVRVHPEYLRYQRVSVPEDLGQLWAERLESIRAFERYLNRQGTIVVKFFLHVGLEEQARRFLKRIDDPERNWKFEANDVKERQHRAAYMEAFEDALNATSRPEAPWYCIPADHKPTMRLRVAELLVQTLERIDPQYPEVGAEERAELLSYRPQLAAAVGEE